MLKDDTLRCLTDDLTSQEISMMKRSFFLSLTAGLLASMAFTTPTHAGTMLATTTVQIIAPAGTQSDEVQVTYSSAPSAPIVILPSTTVSVLTSTIAANTVTITYTPILGNQELDFTFLATPPIAVSQDHLLGVVGPGPVGLIANVTVGPIPEPTSLALLGIGMTGFLALRRFFKRTSVA
jgi:hypothetical protein